MVDIDEFVVSNDAGDIIESDQGNGHYYHQLEGADGNPIKPYWWNSKVWILYGKNSQTTSHKDWDLFLYNANICDLTPGKHLQMADRTPPFHQVGHYIDEFDRKLYYPREFAFIKKELDKILLREKRMTLAQACFNFIQHRTDLDIEGWAEQDIFKH